MNIKQTRTENIRVGGMEKAMHCLAKCRFNCVRACERCVCVCMWEMRVWDVCMCTRVRCVYMWDACACMCVKCVHAYVRCMSLCVWDVCVWDACMCEMCVHVCEMRACVWDVCVCVRACMHAWEVCACIWEMCVVHQVPVQNRFLTAGRSYKAVKATALEKCAATHMSQCQLQSNFINKRKRNSSKWESHLTARCVNYVSVILNATFPPLENNSIESHLSM